jgi:hypothetical protein
MIPFLDLTNHHTNCTNHYTYLPCATPAAAVAAAAARTAPPERQAAAVDAAEREELCLFWFAGRAVAAGEEVCNTYGHLTPDQARRDDGGRGQVVKAACPSFHRPRRPQNPTTAPSHHPVGVPAVRLCTGRRAACAVALGRAGRGRRPRLQLPQRDGAPGL